MKSKKYSLTLDQIIDHILNNGSSNGEYPEFIRVCEKNVAGELLNYTLAVTSQDNSINRAEATTIVEEKAVNVMDEVCKSYRVCLKMGMKFGASLIFQLLEK